MWKDFFSAAYRLLKTPSNTRALLDLGDAIALSGWFRASLSKAKSQGGVDLQRDASVLIPENDVLKSKSAHSMGFQYATFLESNSLSPFRSPHPPRDEREWLRERSRVVHDLLHVILGYGIDVEDEIKLNAHLAFSIALPISCLILGGGLLRILVTNPTRFPQLVREVLEIREKMKGRRCLILEPIEDWLDLSVDDVRARLALSALSAKHF